MTLQTDRARRAPIVAVSGPAQAPIYIAVVQPLEIGRDCAGLIVTDPAISRRHLLLVEVQGGVRVTDLGTTNGTTIAGVPIGANHTLGEGDVVCFGRSTLALVATCPVDSPTPGAATSDAPLCAEVDLRATSIELVANAVLSESPRPPVESDVGTVTLVFSDIENSTTRAVELGDAQWIKVIETHNAIVRGMVARHGGTEVKAQGDGFMLRFRSARSAIACMIDVQRALGAHATAQPLEAVRVRTGIHTGEVILGDDGDIYGRHVIMAARLSAQARGGEILVSSLVRDIVEPRGEVVFGTSRTVTLKGLGGSHLVHPVTW